MCPRIHVRGSWHTFKDDADDVDNNDGDDDDNEDEEDDEKEESGRKTERVTGASYELLNDICDIRRIHPIAYRSDGVSSTAAITHTVALLFLSSVRFSRR